VLRRRMMRESTTRKEIDFSDEGRRWDEFDAFDSS
jgi:hypothetical protein